MSPVGHGKQAGPPGRGARHGEGSKGSVTAEGAGEEALRPTWGAATHVPWFCLSAPGKVRAWHPKKGVMPGKGWGTHYTQSPGSTGHISPEFPIPVMTLTGRAAPSPWDKLLFF